MILTEMICLQRADHKSLGILLLHYINQFIIVFIDMNAQKHLVLEISCGAYKTLQLILFLVLVDKALGKTDTALQHAVNEYSLGGINSPATFKHHPDQHSHDHHAQ